MITLDQLKDIQQRADKLKQYLQIDEKRIQLEEEELHTQTPDFWNDAKAAEAQMKKVKSIKRWIEGYDDVRKATDELTLSYDFFRDEVVTEEEVDNAYANALAAVEDLEMRNMLSADFHLPEHDRSGSLRDGGRCRVLPGQRELSCGSRRSSKSL